MNKNLLIRTLVAAVAIPIILWICYQGNVWMWGMVTLFALVATGEFMVAEGYTPRRVVFWFGELVVLVNMCLHAPRELWMSVPGQVVLSSYFLLVALPSTVVVFLVTGMALCVRNSSPAELFRTHARLMWGAVYLLGLYPFVILVGIILGVYNVEGMGVGGDWLLFLFGLLWIGDSAAMFIGKVFGKHKLAPAVSPNKTVEGFVGGVIGSIAVAVLLGFWRLTEVPVWQLMLIAAACSVAGQLGDLVESMWKRSLNLKDSSAIIPGHGGVLDRFDSLLFAAPIMCVGMSMIVQWR
jgi:CDP-diglyceride synthetase